MTLRKVVFLDRDGTIIEDKIYLNDPNDIHYLPNVFESLKKMRDAGFDFVIVTNQSGVARGIVDPKNIQEIHRRIRNEFNKIGVDILDFFYAPYLPVTNHYLRKPNPGMLFEAAQKYKIKLEESWMVGDRMTDVEAGHRAGTKTALLGNLEPPEESPFLPPEVHVESLLDVANAIVSQS